MSQQSVKEFYAGKNIFITGGTGFVGLCLVEKLLRCVPTVGNIYLLMRPKKGKDIEERLEELKENQIFETLLEEKTPEEIFSKLKPIAGDVGQPDLAINSADRQLLIDNVNIFFHSAATLDFAETLKTCVDVNLLGTRRCLNLAKECKNLDVYVHVSSTYVNSWRLDADEIIYPTSQDVENLISLASSLPESELESKLPELLGNHINSYTLTKHLGEHEVQKHQEGFPCTIVRPSMIIAAWKEPTPGWTISKNGPQGFLMGASKGVVRRLPVPRKIIYDYIPVDIVVNELIVAAFHAAVTKSKVVEVYQCSSSTRKPFRWMEVEDHINSLLHTYPLKSAVWYPHLKFLPTLTWFKISAIFLHLFPALLLDTFTRICGGKPVLMKLHRNIFMSLGRLHKFIDTEWKFSATETHKLHEWLTASDQAEFGLNIDDINWLDYFGNLTKGVRVYLSKENMKNIEVAKGKDTLLMVLHLVYQAVIYSFLWFICSCIVGLPMTKIAFVVPIFYIICSFL